MTIAELHQNYPIVDWIQFIRHFTPNEVSLPEKVIVTTPSYFKQLTDWLVNSAQREDGITTQHLREFFTTLMKARVKYVATWSARSPAAPQLPPNAPASASPTPPTPLAI
jgi:hypothetical protein